MLPNYSEQAKSRSQISPKMQVVAQSAHLNSDRCICAFSIDMKWAFQYSLSQAIQYRIAPERGDR